MENQNTVNRSETPEPDQSGRDIYTDPALLSETRDPIAEFLKQQWKPVLIIVVLAFATIYIRDTLRASHQAGLEASANSFFKAQKALEDFKVAKKKVSELESKPLPEEKEKLATEEKARTEAREQLQALDERLKQATLVLSDALEPYNKLATLINALSAKERGDVAVVKGLAEQFSAQAISQLKGADRTVFELSALAVARALLDSAESEKRALEMLKMLVDNGQIVEVSAALTLARLASSDEEKQQAQAMLKALAEKRPEQAALLKPEIK